MDTDQKLHFEGLREPIHTRVTRRSQSGLTVEQALPFLKLNTRVQDDARRDAHIQSVSVVVYDGMPRLVLDLAYEAEAAAQGQDGLEPFAPVNEPAASTHSGVVRARRSEPTKAFETLPPPAPPVEGVGESPRDDGSVIFRTPASGPEQLSLEEQLLRSGTFSYGLQQRWQVVRPGLEHALWVGGRIVRAVDARLRPLVLAGARQVWRLSRAGWSGGRRGLGAGVTKVRARLAARRRQRALPSGVSEDVDAG